MNTNFTSQFSLFRLSTVLIRFIFEKKGSSIKEVFVVIIPNTVLIFSLLGNGLVGNQVLKDQVKNAK
jgi:hypothetical protein